VDLLLTSWDAHWPLGQNQTIRKRMSASKEEIREAMKMLWDIDAEVDEALDSLIKEGLVEVEVEEHE
jgi:hypothetical protein